MRLVLGGHACGARAVYVAAERRELALELGDAELGGLLVDEIGGLHPALGAGRRADARVSLRALEDLECRSAHEILRRRAACVGLSVETEAQAVGYVRGIRGGGRSPEQHCD